MPSAETNETLEAVCESYAIELPQEQIARLDRYCQLLWQWNRKLNLTRHTDYEKFVTRDVVDSLQLASLLDEGEQVLDVGTGGGVPGVLLAILRPDLDLALCESVGKKATVVENMARELELQAAIFHARAEDLLDDFRYDALVARAVGPLWKLLRWFEPHWLSIGRLLVVKGPKWVEERKEARHRGLLHGLELRRAIEYQTPGAGSQNVILSVCAKTI